MDEHRKHHLSERIQVTHTEGLDEVCGGQAFGLVVKILLGMPVSHTEGLSASHGSTLHSSLLLLQLLGGRCDGSMS